MFEALNTAKTIAVVGLSSKEYRTSNHIAHYLIEHGYSIIPVNPKEESVMGLVVYPSLSEIPTDMHIDIINIYRNNTYTAELMKEIRDFVYQRGYKPLVWTQLDVSSPEAEQIAAMEDIPYVKNKCIMVEHRNIT